MNGDNFPAWVFEGETCAVCQRAGRPFCQDCIRDYVRNVRD